MTTIMTTYPQDLPTDEINLAHEARANAEAFGELYRRHVTRVYRYHMAHTGNVKDAEDLTSQTFIAALEGIRSFRGTGSFAAWLLGIAARKKAMFFRSGRLRDEIPIEAAQQIPSPSLGADQLANQRLRLESITHALKQISPERADAIALCFFSELTYAEAGLVLQKSEAAAKMLVTRGLQDLRERTSLVFEVEL
ncbi:MAG: RNA polymerase sigma factor [Chloroflexi bacterium]|nr:RNA polymerase sigma factor [Chloroflexota bacterium]